jgi:NADPH-dependent 2,4-dienoyl-CoA reductase/sulfur reductase-like enzyme
VRVEKRGITVFLGGPLRQRVRGAVPDGILDEERRRPTEARRGNLGGKTQMLQDARDDRRLVDQRDQTEATAVPRPCSGRP